MLIYARRRPHHSLHSELGNTSASIISLREWTRRLPDLSSNPDMFNNFHDAFIAGYALRSKWSRRVSVLDRLVDGMHAGSALAQSIDLWLWRCSVNC